jgi:uncharacterized protein with HEPN domain
MPTASAAAALTDILNAILIIRQQMADATLAAFEADKPKRWIVERGIEIISEASRRLPQELKARHPRYRGRRWQASATCCATSSRVMMDSSPASTARM